MIDPGAVRLQEKSHPADPDRARRLSHVVPSAACRDPECIRGLEQFLKDAVASSAQ